LEDGVALAGMGAWAAPTGLVAMVVAQDPAMVATAPTGLVAMVVAQDPAMVAATMVPAFLPSPYLAA